MKLAVVLLVIVTSTFAEYQEIYVVDATNSKVNDGPPIEPEFINAISSSTNTEECLKVYIFLLGHYKAVESNIPVSLAKLKKDAEKYSKKPTNSINPQTCLLLLDNWNRKLAVIYEGANAQRILRLSLRSIKRGDLERLMLQSIENRNHEELKAVEKEIKNHHQKSRSHNRTSPVSIEGEAQTCIWIINGLLGLAILIPITLSLLIKQFSFKTPSFSKKKTITNTSDKAEQIPSIV